jgi:hypothetical protein
MAVRVFPHTRYIVIQVEGVDPSAPPGSAQPVVREYKDPWALIKRQQIQLLLRPNT